MKFHHLPKNKKEKSDDDDDDLIDIMRKRKIIQWGLICAIYTDVERKVPYICERRS